MDHNAVLYLGVGSILIFSTVSRLILRRQRASFCKLHGCQPGKSLIQNHLLLGFDVISKFKKWIANGVYMQETTKWLADNGSTFSVVIAGSRITWTSDPENIKALLTLSDFDLSAGRIKTFYPFTGDSTFSSKGPVWSRGRALLRPCFSRLQVANFDIYEKNFSKLCELIPRDGSPVDLQQLFKRFTIDTASEILFGESVNSLSDELSSKEISAAFDKGSQGVFERGNMGILLWMHWDPNFTRSCNIVHDYIGKFVEKAIQLRTSSKTIETEEGNTSGRTRYIFLEELARETSDRKLLQDQITGALAAGRDTTAALLSFTLWVLVRHPRILQTLQMQVAKLEGELPSYEQLQNMNYLQWILKETLRLYTVIPFNSRGAERDTYLPKGGGVDGKSPVFVPKGRLVLYSSYAVHRSPEIWGPNAGEFVPERWKDSKSIQSSKYFPFGSGPRTCPGQQLALVESAYIVVRLLQTFSTLESKDDTPFREVVAINLSLSNGVWVSLRE